MRPKHISLFLLFLVTVLSGCVFTVATSEVGRSTPEPAALTVTPMPTEIPTLAANPLPSPNALSTTAASTQTSTLIPIPTLEAEQAEETTRALLQEQVDCPAPCFWGIIPGQTSLEEAVNIFTHLGLTLQFANERDNKKFYEVIYDYQSGLSISPLLTVQDGLVKNLRIYITPEKPKAGVPREWLAYSPETLITRYGVPSRVEFFLGRGEPTTDFAMVIYLDAVDLIVQYGGTDLFTPITSLSVCPPTAQFDGVYLWLGKSPEHPPGHGVPLEEATSLTLEEFAERMTGDPESTCLELKDDAFP